MTLLTEWSTIANKYAIKNICHGVSNESSDAADVYIFFHINLSKLKKLCQDKSIMTYNLKVEN